ncbi:MAG: NAD(P)-dependent oxidoreductase [Mariprofundaceae bacterium]|nr:NAD(P)-dependent oxidoreductase [Mariprofundaceae bacterium]
MKYLITGGSGFIGSNLIEELLKQKCEILNIDIKAPNIDSHQTYWKECDILDMDQLILAFQVFNPTHVIHLAARTDTLSDNIEDYVNNTEGTDNVLTAINAINSIERVIITSTQFVNQYHGAPKHDQDFAPHTAYGESKVMNEKATRAANLKCIWTIIRPTNVWGPWHLRYPHEFWRILGKGMYFHPSGAKVMRSYGYVKNVVYQIMKMCDAPSEKVNGKVYYVGDMPIDLLDWVNGFSVRQTGKKVRVVPRAFIRLLAFMGDGLNSLHIKSPITSSRYKSMTTSNDAPMEDVLKEFGQPPYSLDEGIEETVDWLKKYHPDIINLP